MTWRKCPVEKYSYRNAIHPLLAECQVALKSFAQVMPRLATFMAPFVKTFCRPEPDRHADTSVCGLLSDVEHKNVESMAYRCGNC